MGDFLINRLREALLNASVQSGESLFDSMVEAVREATGCRMCTLWTINNNNTNGGFRSASLFIRKLEPGIRYPFSKDEDFVHDLTECFIKYVLSKTEKSKLPYYACTIDECGIHRSADALKQLGLNYFINIPIPNKEHTQTIALLKISFVDDPRIGEIAPIATTICNAVSSCFFRLSLYKKQQLIEDLIENYKGKGRKNLKNIFHPIIHTLFKKYFDYEGASVFLWNSYDNRFNLLTTTGIASEDNGNNIFYYAGEGLTGKVAKGEKTAKIYDNLLELEKRNAPEYKHKFKEETSHEGKTMLVVPILRPSNPDSVTGIIRFTNKINRQSKENGTPVVDYFNDSDIELIDYASHYLALNIDYFLGEEERNDFISKLSHESKTPANAIRVSADRVMKKAGDSTFIRSQFMFYMQSIIDYADLQIMQASTNLYISKFHRNSPKSKKYNVKKLLITDVIKDSINIIRPYARDRRNIRFENITVHEDFPQWYLYIDDNAFKIIFYNLLTNAIKYVRKDTEFQVSISGTETDDKLIIHVSDYGLGIQEKDKEDIFLLGVRSQNAIKQNNEGYGIGLHVVQQILKDFDAEISVSNCFFPTTFELKLPKKLFSNYKNTQEWNR